MVAGCPLVAVLAAGTSTRFGSDKLLARVAGRPLLDWTLEAVLEAVAATDVRVVVADDAGARADAARARDATLVVANRAAEGMRASLDAAFAAARQARAHGLVVVLADDPLAARELPAVLARAAADPDAFVAIRRTPPVPHPVYVPTARMPAPIAPGDRVPDQGLRALIPATGTIWLAPACQVTPIDVDRPADLERLAAELLAASD